MKLRKRTFHYFFIFSLLFSCAAFTDPLNCYYTVHLVNNGAKRNVAVLNIPSGVKVLNIYKTGSTDGMTNTGSINVTDGKAVFDLDAECYVTLTNKKL